VCEGIEEESCRLLVLRSGGEEGGELAEGVRVVRAKFEDGKEGADGLSKE
jgi:hypothetical protein